MTNKSTKIKIALIIIIVLCFWRACSTSPPPAQITESPTAQRDIARILVANNIKGCGDMNYSLNSGTSGEYTVNCSPDSKNWTTYLVWINTGTIIKK